MYGIMNKKNVFLIILISYMVFSVLEAILIFYKLESWQSNIDNAVKIRYNDSLSTVISYMGEPDTFFEKKNGDTLCTEIYYWYPTKKNSLHVKLQNGKVTFMQIEK